MALRAHLLDELIPALIAARPPEEKRRRTAPDTPLRPDRRHRPEDLRRWLTTIAEHLRDNHTPDWRWWHLPAYTLTTSRTRRQFRTAIGLAVGLWAGLVFGLWIGLAVGLAVGLWVGRMFARPDDQPPPHALPRIAGRIPELRKRLVFGLAVWLVGGLVLGLPGSAWFKFLITTVWQNMHRRGCLPASRRVMPMLRDCHRLGLLRTVGPVYQFRHSQLQDHLTPPRPLAQRVGPAGAAHAHGRS